MKCFKGRSPFSVNVAMQGLDKSNHSRVGWLPPVRVRTHTGIYDVVLSCCTWISFEVACPLNEYTRPGFCCGHFCEWPFHWLCRNFWIQEPVVCIRPCCSLPFPTEPSVLSIWYTKDLLQCEENPPTNIIRVSHQNKLSFWEWKQTECMMYAFLQSLLIPVLEEQRPCGEAPWRC